MATYLIRRVLIAILTLWLITFLVYGLIRAMPGDALTVNREMLGPGQNLNEDDIKQARAIFGLDKPWYTAYWDWLGNLLRGDLGRSFNQKIAVSQVIGDRIGNTLLLSVTSLVLAYLLSIPIGLYSSARANKPDERVVSTLLYMLYSLPAFVAALLLQVLFAVKLRDTGFELPLFGMRGDNFNSLSTFQQVIDVAKHMILPVFCFTYGVLAYESRFIRANMQEVVRQDYIRTARAKGVGPIRILWHHAFRNTLIPFVTLIGLTLPALLSGAVILEQIFSWPGVGTLMFESINMRDYTVIMGLTLIFSIVTLLGQLLADFLYSVVDPRVTYS
jgi:peptide/nickel transport system permease protein